MKLHFINFQFLIIILTGVVVFSAMAYDLKWRRIPNFITFPSIFLGLTMHTLHAGRHGFYISLIGLLVAGGVFLIPYLMGGIGAGDVKLLGGVGALLAADKIITVLLLTTFIGGLMAMFKILANTSFANRLKYHLIDITKKDRLMVRNGNIDPRKDTIPYGIAIGIGTLITLAL